LKGVEWSYRATSPLLRSDFAQSTAGQTPNGDLTDSFVPATEEPSRHGKVVDMQTQATIEAVDPPIAGKPARRRNGARRMGAWLLRALRGDKYMANAYPPAWRSPAEPRVGAGAVRGANNGHVHAALRPSPTQTEER
jgi:hypothetical protein